MYGGSGTDYVGKMERERQLRIGEGTQAINRQFTGFDPSFYAQREKAYQDVALPQFYREQKDTTDALAGGLSRRGLRQSSAAEQRMASLGLQGDKARREIVDASKDYSNQVRSGVENTRSGLMSQLLAGGNPNAIGQQAQQQANALRMPSPMTPIGSFFEDWTRNYMVNSAARNYTPGLRPMWG